MKYSVVSMSALLLGASWAAYAQSAPPAAAKTGIIYLRTAIISTQEGRKALADLHARFEPTKTKLAKQQAAIQADQVRVSSPSKDELQEAMRALREHDFGVALQFGNYR